MATLILSAVGTLIGGPFGGAIGALVGRQLDGRIFGAKGREGARLNELKVTTSSYGMPIPRQFGKMRVSGQIIWATDLIEHSERQGGGKSGPSVTNYTYTASFAVALSSRPIRAVGRIWADGKLLRGEAGDLKTAGTFRLHSGTGDQPTDPLIAAAETPGQCPAYRGLAYAVFEDLHLADFGNRIPALSFEVIADQEPLDLGALLDGVVDDYAAEVALPGIAGLSIEGSLAETLAALDPFYPVDCDACDDQLVLRPDLRNVPAQTLPEAATSSEQDDFGGKDGYSRKRNGEPEAPVAVIRYYDTDRDYQPGAQRASGRPLPGQPRTIELPAALDAASARAAVERAAKREGWSRQVVTWRVTQLDPQIRPGQTVRLPGHAGLWRVRDWEWRAQGVELTLVRLSPIDTNGILAADPGRAITAPDNALVPTRLTACELPWDGNSGTPVPLILALASASSPNWAGAALYVDHGDGALVPLGPTGRGRAIIGTGVSALAAASPMLFDRRSNLLVDLAGADLTIASASMRQLAMGANRALIGAEIIQFADAVPVAPGRWLLSGLWRGRGGTESAVAGHLPGEDFALLNGAGIVVSAEVAGEIPGTEIVAIGLGDSAPVARSIALRGIGLRPLSPVHPRWAALAGGGGVQLSWTRRSRGGWLWQDGVDVPLAEQSEVYEITFETSGATLARWSSAAPTFSFMSGELAALTTAHPDGRIAIRQQGDRALSQPLLTTPPQA